MRYFAKMSFRMLCIDRIYGDVYVCGGRVIRVLDRIPRDIDMDQAERYDLFVGEGWPLEVRVDKGEFFSRL